MENINCSEKSKDTAWHIELNFAKDIIDYLEEKDPQKYKDSILFFTERQEVLEEAGKNRGLADNLFFNSPTKNEALKIRKGFAFAENDKFEEVYSQSDVYFIMSTILNELRNSEDKNRSIKQTEYARVLISPGNFNRFNDGILQASLLRSANNDELRYDLSDEMSYQMMSVLGDMISNIEDEHAEGLIEFFYAMAIKKLRLPLQIIMDCIELLREEVGAKSLNPNVLMAIVDYLDDEVCPKTTIHEKFNKVEVES